MGSLVTLEGELSSYSVPDMGHQNERKQALFSETPSSESAICYHSMLYPDWPVSRTSTEGCAFYSGHRLVEVQVLHM